MLLLFVLPGTSDRTPRRPVERVYGLCPASTKSHFGRLEHWTIGGSAININENWRMV